MDTCAVTKKPRARLPDRSLSAERPSRSGACGSAEDARRAGNRPTTSGAASETSNVNASTRPFSSAMLKLSSVPAEIQTIAQFNSYANAMPSPAAASEINKLSVRRWRISR